MVMAMEKKQPKYTELVNWIQEQIASKKFLPGQKIYSENRLKEMFQVSRQTVRHAIAILEEEGVLIRKRGSGTYINNIRRENLENRTRIAVVTTYVDGYIFPKTIQGIENILFENGYSVQIAFTNNQISREKTILEDILSRDEVAGVIMETTKSGLPNPNLPLYEKLQQRKSGKITSIWPSHGAVRYWSSRIASTSDTPAVAAPTIACALALSSFCAPCFAISYWLFAAEAAATAAS